MKINKGNMIKEAKKWSLFIVMAFISLKIIFYKESSSIVIRFLLSMIYIYTLPGFFILNLLIDKIDFSEKIIIGTGVGFGIISIISYYMGLFRLGFFVQTILLPITLIALTFVAKSIFEKRTKELIRL